MSTPVCGQCGLAQAGYYWRDTWYCSLACAHIAGDRSMCGRNCGCTGFAKKRRLLREHRVQMRIMDQMLTGVGLAGEVEAELMDENDDTGFWLGYDTASEGMDENTDGEDPEAEAKQQVQELRQEATDQQALVAAVQGALGCQAVVTDLERARMRLEDHRALGLA